MAIKTIALVALFGQLVLGYPPEYHGYEHHEEHHAPAPYHFEYGVKDPYTHDIKSQHEVSDGHGNVKGSYSLLEADGSTRVVEYTADDHNGFNAEVKKIEGPGYKAPYSAPAYKAVYPAYPAPAYKSY